MWRRASMRRGKEHFAIRFYRVNIMRARCCFHVRRCNETDVRKSSAPFIENFPSLFFSNIRTSLFVGAPLRSSENVCVVASMRKIARSYHSHLLSLDDQFNCSVLIIDMLVVIKCFLVFICSMKISLLL